MRATVVRDTSEHPEPRTPPTCAETMKRVLVRNTTRQDSMQIDQAQG